MAFVSRRSFSLTTLLVVCLLMWGVAPGADAAPEPRSKVVLNAGWQYVSGDVEGFDGAEPEAMAFGEAQSEAVNVPHGFVQPYWMDRVHFGGVGWYQRSLPIEGIVDGKRLHLEFEGVFQHCHVFVNDEFVGEHRGGFTGFTFDITDHVRGGEENTLTIRVSAEWDPRIAPRTGDFSFIGGIYRDVYLVATSPVHVPWRGTFVSTPFDGPLTDTRYSLPTEYARAPVLARTEVRNGGGEDAEVRVHTRVEDAEGQEVASAESTLAVPAGGLVEFEQASEIEDPRFWSPDDPYLYTVRTEVYVGEDRVDAYTTPLGVRWFQATAEEGFWLNGKRLWLRGFNVHQDHSGWGWAVTNSGFHRDMRLMREAGANFIRGSHYPKDPALIEACDRFGMLMMEELAYWGRGGGGGPPASPERGSADFAPFVENVEQQLEAMIRSSRNNPSVFAWSLTNEPTGGELETTPLMELARRLDPTRPTVRVTNFSTGEADIYGRNGYNPDKGRAPVFFSELWEREELRPGGYPSRPDPESPYSMGTARWAGFDYGTHHDWNLNLVGVCDNARVPKRRWHWHREVWLGIDPPAWPEPGEPASLSIDTDKTLLGSNGQDDTQLRVRVLDAQGRWISHELEVTLEVEGGPARFPTGRTLSLATPDGEAGISVRGYEAGRSRVTVSAPGLEPASVELIFVEGGVQVVLEPEAWPDPASRSLPELPNLALGRPAEASSAQNQNPVGDAVDGDTGTRWCATSEAADQWWRVDLGEAKAIGGVGVVFEQYVDYGYVIETSDDGEAWTVAVGEAERASSRRQRYHAFEATCRYVRVRYTRLPEGVWASHREVLVYPAEGGR